MTACFLLVLPELLPGSSVEALAYATTGRKFQEIEVILTATFSR